MENRRFSIKHLPLLAITLLIPTLAEAQSSDAQAPAPNPPNISCSTVKTRETINSKLVDKYHTTSINTTGAQLQVGTVVVWKIIGDNPYPNGQQFSVPLNKPIFIGAQFTMSAWTIPVNPNLPLQTSPLTCTAWIANPQPPNM